jgi:uroporphyrinogen decarboxylase
VTSCERIRRTFLGQAVDRIGVVDYYWGPTVARWRQEGLGQSQPEYAFDHDIIYFFFDPRFGFEEKVLAEDDEYRTIYTIDGEILKIPKDPDNTIRKTDVLGIPVDYTIKTRGDWERHRHLYTAGEWRLHSNPPLSGSWFGVPDLDYLRNRYQEAAEGKRFKCLVFREPYECVREVLGTEGMLTQMALDPGFVAEMLEHNLQITFRMIEIYEELGMPMDGYWVWGDIAYNKGLMFSPEMYDRLIRPFHERLFERLGEFFIYHTDGFIQPHLPHLLEVGIRGINPLEVKAGNDFFAIVDRFGEEMVITGGIDVRILCSNDQKAIERELKAKIRHGKRKKYIFHSDHSIPPDVSLDTYRFVIEKVRELGEY